MFIISTTLVLLYLGLIGFFLKTWSTIPSLTSFQANPESYNTFSILIPVRNEASNIASLIADLNRQNYPKSNYEIILINDHSTDDTEAIIRRHLPQIANLRLINLNENVSFGSYKKAAITSGINASSNDIIITTDGDCRVNENWLPTINNYFNSYDIACLCGPVMYEDDNTFFSKLQITEFAALIGSGAACIATSHKGMCNGANFAYTKSAFYAVGGFDGIDQIPSGDDELLMHKIWDKFPRQVFFLKHRKAIVTTRPNASLQQLFNQRKRWAGKWSFYKDWKVKSLAIFIFLVNLYFAAGWLLVLTGYLDWKLFLIQYLFKAIIECAFISKILGFFNKKLHLICFLFLQIVYPCYTTFFGIVANFGGYEWKERKVNGK